MMTLDIKVKVATMTVPIIRHSEEMLLVQKAVGRSNAGNWLFPGGKVEADEFDPHFGFKINALEQSALRELHEETGIVWTEEQDKLRYLCSFIAMVKDVGNCLCAVYLMMLDGKAPIKLQKEELSAYAWVSHFGLLDYSTAVGVPQVSYLAQQMCRSVKELEEL